MQSYAAGVYLEVLQALRTIINDKPIDEVMQSCHSIGEAIEAIIVDTAKSIVLKSH